MKRIAIPFLLTMLIIAAAAADDKGLSKDHGQKPWVVEIEKATLDNSNFRTVLWTGKHLQLTVMSIKPGGEIGLERHEGTDQFLRVESGEARVVMGPDKATVTFDEKVSDNWIIMVPAGMWHNVINLGDSDLKVYSLYAPPEHQAGTVHKTPEDAADDEHH